MPCDIVRLPCGSMSQQRTRLPRSAKATARLSVVVVLATPPFWFAKAMTLAWGVLTGVLRLVRVLGPMLGGDSQSPWGFLPLRTRLYDARSSIAGGCPEESPTGTRSSRAPWAA